MAAAWRYDCPLVWKYRPDTPYTLFSPQNGIVGIFEYWKRWLHNKIKTFESWSHHCCTSSSASEMTLYRTWKNNHCEGLTNPKSKGSKKGLWVSLSSTPHASQHRKAYPWSWWPDAAMWSCNLCMDGWLLWKHLLAFNQAALLQCMRSTRICIWRRAFIIVPIERLFAILQKHATGC